MLWFSQPCFILVFIILIALTSDARAQDIHTDDPAMAVLDAEGPNPPVEPKAEDSLEESSHHDATSPVSADITNVHALKAGSEDRPPGSQDFITLPVGSWSILDLNETQRGNVCKDQIDFCANQCGGSQNAQTNFCNQTSMAWGCTCQNKIPDCPPYEWPVTVAECQGRTKTCQAGCTDQATREICQNRCTHYFRCHQPGGMKSQLQVENPGQTPTYQLPNSVKRLSAAPVAFDIALTATIIMLATNLAVL